MQVDVRRWLVFDEVGQGFKGLPVQASRPLVAVRLSVPVRPVGTTEWLTYDEVLADRIQVWSGPGSPDRDDAWDGPVPVHTNLPFDRRPDALDLARQFPGATGRGLVPGLLVTEQRHERHVERTVYSCSRIRESGMIFSRIWTGEHPTDLSPSEAVREACAQSKDLHERFSDESNQIRRFDEDVEIELKYTMPDEVSPWFLASDLAAMVQRREIEGFIPDLGNELKRWSYTQDTFEILSPDKAGYVAFMRYPAGLDLVKYKFFDQDSLRRMEKVDVGVTVDPGQYQEYLRSKVEGADFRPLPRLTRTRFDVVVESTSTGHFFGLEVDEVRAAGRVLRQLEIEYHQSRACLGVTAETVEPELFRLADMVEHRLKEWGLRAERGYLSKLSFLKEAAAGDPAPDARP
jgi:hypothetical protein